MYLLNTNMSAVIASMLACWYYHFAQSTTAQPQRAAIAVDVCVIIFHFHSVFLVLTETIETKLLLLPLARSWCSPKLILLGLFCVFCSRSILLSTFNNCLLTLSTRCMPQNSDTNIPLCDAWRSYGLFTFVLFDFVFVLIAEEILYFHGQGISMLWHSTGYKVNPETKCVKSDGAVSQDHSKLSRSASNCFQRWFPSPSFWNKSLYFSCKI